MPLALTNHSMQRTLVIGCVFIALLALPFSGILHCAGASAADDHADAPRAEACCVFLCLTILIGALVIPPKWLPMTHVTLNLKPVRLMNYLTRWVPPPRSIGFPA